MTKNICTARAWPILIAGIVVGIVCVLSVVAVLPPAIQAAPSALPPRPDPGLPPRPDPQPVPPSTLPAPSSDKSESPVGCYIDLQVHAPQSMGWTVVQWQDDQGNWHDVEGWQGTLDAGHKKWWVDLKDFGRGPFRWLVYRDDPGEPQFMSEPFYLPQVPFETTTVKASTAP